MYTQQDLDRVLGELHQGPLGKRSEGRWNQAFHTSFRLKNKSKGRVTRPKTLLVTRRQVSTIKNKYTNFVHPNDLMKKYNLKRDTLFDILFNRGGYRDVYLYGQPVKRHPRCRYYVKELTTGKIGSKLTLATEFNVTPQSITLALDGNRSLFNKYRFVRL